MKVTLWDCIAGDQIRVNHHYLMVLFFTRNYTYPFMEINYF